MVSVVAETIIMAAQDADADRQFIRQRDLFWGLRQQLALADQLGFDLVALRIAESLDQLAAELGIPNFPDGSTRPH